MPIHFQIMGISATSAVLGVVFLLKKYLEMARLFKGQQPKGTTMKDSQP